MTIFHQLDQRTNAADIRADLARIDEAEGQLDTAKRTLRALLRKQDKHDDEALGFRVTALRASAAEVRAQRSSVANA